MCSTRERERGEGRERDIKATQNVCTWKPWDALTAQRDHTALSAHFLCSWSTQTTHSHTHPSTPHLLTNQQLLWSNRWVTPWSPLQNYSPPHPNIKGGWYALTYKACWKQYNILEQTPRLIIPPPGSDVHKQILLCNWVFTFDRKCHYRLPSS